MSVVIFACVYLKVYLKRVVCFLICTCEIRLKLLVIAKQLLTKIDYYMTGKINNDFFLLQFISLKILYILSFIEILCKITVTAIDHGYSNKLQLQQ